MSNDKSTHKPNTWTQVWNLCETNARKQKRILVSRCLKAMTPYIHEKFIMLDEYPIAYTTTRWFNLFEVYDLSHIPGFDWIKFTTPEQHREQYWVLVNYLDNYSATQPK